MRNYQKSDYALNKFARGIVYRFADKTVEVTTEAYLTANPGNTLADFQLLKAASDAIYYTQDRADAALRKKQLSLSWLDETQSCSVHGADGALDDAERGRERRVLALQALDKLTPIQRRRYIKHFSLGLSEAQIALAEHTTQQAVSKSLVQAETKIMQFMEICKKGL